MNKPSIVSVIGERVELRRAGKEFVGRCPLHQDTNPSFFVSEQKQVFHCFGCGESDVIDFIVKIDGVLFQEACAQLGIETDEPRPAPSAAQRKAGERAAAWMAEQRRKINVLLGT